MKNKLSNNSNNSLEDVVLEQEHSKTTFEKFKGSIKDMHYTALAYLKPTWIEWVGYVGCELFISPVLYVTTRAFGANVLESMAYSQIPQIVQYAVCRAYEWFGKSTLNKSVFIQGKRGLINAMLGKSTTLDSYIYIYSERVEQKYLELSKERNVEEKIN